MRRVGSIVAGALLLTAAPAMAWTTVPFTESGLSSVSGCRGVYVIKRNDEPYYVGRSRDIAVRLKRHLAGSGSRKVAEILGGNATLTVSYECGDSNEQMEARLIAELGTYKVGNLRRETDPADWDD
ncbi:MAG TPA: GIY-YIG nuclease family protein [Allosphingosinicella sp.]|jgi:predicted GIY-YIG superfamily endonuclease